MPLLRNAALLDSALPQGRVADVLVRGERIVAIETPGAIISGYEEEIDLRGRALIPGLVNAHTHSHAHLSRGVADRWTLESLLNAAPWTGGGRRPEHQHLSALIGAAEMVAKGATAVYDMFAEFPHPSVDGVAAMAQGYEEAGVRAVLAPMMADRSFYEVIAGVRQTLPADLAAVVDGIRAAPFEASLEHCRRIHAGWRHSDDRIRLGLVPTIPLHCSDPFIAGCARMAAEHGLPVQMHIAESPVQAALAGDVYGETLLAHVDRLGLVSPRFTAAHGVWLTDEDLRRLSGRGGAVAHNPGSNLRLGSGIARFRAMLDAGITVGIGTDGLTSSDNLNMFEAMRVATHVSRVINETQDRWIGAGEAFDAATTGGARLCGWGDRIGRIAPHFLADLVVLDLGATHYLPLNNLLQQIVYCEDGTGVESVMIGGAWVYRDRRHTRIDLAALRSKANDAALDLAERNRALRATSERLEPFVGRFCNGIRARFHAGACC